jgi:hypothetical protein
MIAAHREIVAKRIRVGSAFDFPHAAPENIRGVPILLVAGHHATLAADALGHVEVKAILLAGSRWRWQRDV